MSERRNLFFGTLEDFENVDLEKPLSESHRPTCDFYHNVYHKAALIAEECKDSPSTHVYAFLAILTNFVPKFDTPADPYGPMFVFHDKRGCIPSDLSESDIAALQKVAPKTKDPALRARLHDVLWVLKKDHNACAEAAKQYFEAGDRLNTNKDWVYAESCYKRGMQLAALLGRSKDLYRDLSDRLVVAVRKSLRGQDARPVRFMNLLLEFKCGDPNEFASAAERSAKKWEQQKDYFKARMRWEVAIDLYRWAKNGDKEKECRLAYAETYVSEAKQKGSGPDGSGLAGTHFLQLGIEAFRQAGGDGKRIKELKRKLTEYQEASLNEMQTFSADVDLSEPAKSAARCVEGKSLEDALFIFASMRPLEHPEKAKQEVVEQAKKTPLAFLFGANLVDERGRTRANRDGLILDSIEKNQGALEQHAFSSVQFNWNCRALAFIEPARQTILTEHHPTHADLLYIVRDNPLIPIGHEQAFLRGIHAGFHGDFCVASYLLIPQIENSLRHILESAGVDITNLYSDGTQTVKMLGTLFDFPELQQMLGADMCFELRGHLIEKSGYDFRNRLCHGFLADSDFYRAPAVSIWWLVLRLCLAPLYYYKLQQTGMLRGAKPEKRVPNKKKSKTRAKIESKAKTINKTNRIKPNSITESMTKSKNKKKGNP